MEDYLKNSNGRQPKIFKWKTTPCFCTGKETSIFCWQHQMFLKLKLRQFFWFFCNGPIKVLGNNFKFECKAKWACYLAYPYLSLAQLSLNLCICICDCLITDALWDRAFPWKVQSKEIQTSWTFHHQEKLLPHDVKSSRRGH